MRLGINLLTSGTSLNTIKKVPTVTIYQGETFDLFIQLMDADQDGLRYVPDPAATVFVEIARLPEASGTLSNVRQINDYSVRRNAVAAFAGDSSVWKLSLTATETSKMMSSNIRVTVTEGSLKKIALLPQAIKIYRSEG